MKKKKKPLQLKNVSDEDLVMWFEGLPSASKNRIWNAASKKPYIKFGGRTKSTYDSLNPPKVSTLSTPSLWSKTRASFRKISYWFKYRRVRNDIRGFTPNPYVTNNKPPMKYLVVRRQKD